MKALFYFYLFIYSSNSQLIHSYVNITEKNNIVIDKDLQRKKTRKIEITTLKLNYIIISLKSLLQNLN